MNSITPKILKALRSLYKIGIFYVEGIPGSGDASNRSTTQKKCRLKGYCYKDIDGTMNVYSKKMGDTSLTRKVIAHLNNIPGIRANDNDGLYSEFIIEEEP